MECTLIYGHDAAKEIQYNIEGGEESEVYYILSIS